MHECFLNNGIRGIAGDIPDNHSMSGTGIHINIVYAGAGLTDKPKFRRCLQQQVIHLYLVHNQNFAITYPADGLLEFGQAVNSPTLSIGANDDVPIVPASTNTIFISSEIFH